jgi:peroxiredoxin 6
MLHLGQTFPNFEGQSTLGKFDLYQYLGNSWGLLVSHPKDFTPVCTTELSRLANLQTEFTKRNVKTMVISVDSVEDHQSWSKDIEHYSKSKVEFPLIGDPKADLARKLGLLDAESGDRFTVRAVVIISPNKKVKATICYPASSGRNFDEILRLIDSLQITTKHQDLVTPVDWKVGQEMIVHPGVETPANARVVELPSDKDYLRFVQQPV